MKSFIILAIIASAFITIGCSSSKMSRNYSEKTTATENGQETVVTEEVKTRSIGLPIGVVVRNDDDRYGYEYRANHSGLFTRPPYGDNGCDRAYGGSRGRSYGPYTPDGRNLGGRRDPDGVIRYYPTR